jgi:hypothetical protein
LYTHFLRINGHPFLMEFVAHSCILRCSVTSCFPPPHHRTLSLELDFANDDLSDSRVNDTKEIWSVVNHSRLQRRYLSVLRTGLWKWVGFGVNVD